MPALIAPVDVFRALADPTRLAVVERLGVGPASTSELARPFGITMPSLLEHLVHLERIGIVASSKQGRVRTYWLTAAPLDVAGTWLADQCTQWNRRLDQLDSFLAAMPSSRGQPVPVSID